MKTLKFAVAAALAATALPSAAQAAEIITTGTAATTLEDANINSGASNSFTIAFSDASLANPFTELLTFTTDVAGVLNILFNSTAQDEANNVTFTNAFLTGSGITGSVPVLEILGDPNETRALNGFGVGPGTFTLTIQGTPGLENGALGGTVAFRASQAAAVPEPATWALMLLGFGAIGFSMRRRRQGRFIYQAA